MKKSFLFEVSATVLLALLATGCPGRECTVDGDCAGRGAGWVCTGGTCTEPSSDTCEPACSGATPICETSTKTCKACTAATGCSGATPVCDTAASGGIGACVTCTAAAGCSGSTPVCDVSVAGGQCVGCLSSAQCGGTTPVCDTAAKICVACTATEGCSGSTPVCDTAANGGSGMCKTCTPTTGCGGATPVCDPDGNGGAGSCVTCTATGGCSGATPVCDTTVAGGQCVACLDDSTCGGSTPACDTATRTCVTCTATSGCSGATPACDTSVAGGQCVECLDDSTCTSAAAPHCNTSTRTCKFCLADNTGCDAASATPYCDTTTNFGLGTCEVCTPAQGCTPPNGTCRVDLFPRECRSCGADADCAGLPATPYCHVANGACVECLDSGQCGGSTPICDPSSFDCRTCLADNTGCAGGTPVCDVSGGAGDGACVECLEDSTCSGATPVCDTEAKACRTCLADHRGCSGATPYCDASAGGGMGACGECISQAHCAPTQDCDLATLSCVTPATPPATASAQIAAVRAAADGAIDPALPIQGALVTYKRPLVGTDVAGFFIQAEQTGPAIFVAMDPDALTPVPQVGDRVDMNVLSVATVGGLKQINLMTDFAVLSSGHPIAPLAQDVSAATDLVSNLDGYESEVVRIDSATVLASFGGAGTGFVSAQISTTGYPAGDNMKLRIPDTLRASMDLEQNCVVTLNFGPMWRFNAQAQPAAYGSELSATCPAPVMLAASANDGTHVKVNFSRQILPSSVNADGSQFAITGLAVSAATVDGNVVTLTTDAQAPGITYSLSAAGTLTDLLGTPVVTPNSADFTGYQPAPTGLKINEVDYDQPGTDGAEFIELYNNGTTAVPLAGLAVVLVNGSSSPSPEYARLDLSTAVDETGAPVTEIAPGGYLVIASGAVTVPNGVARILFGAATNNIQNGGTAASPSADAVALVDTGALTVLDALSYEGSITSANITGFSAPVSLVEGTPPPGEDSGAVAMSVSRIPNGADSDNAAADWSFTTTLTPGVANVYTP